MIADKELWACARTVLDQHGIQAPVFVAERIGALVLQGDQAGIDTWTAIAARLDQLMGDDGLRQ